VTSPETVKLCQELAPRAKVLPSNGNGWGHANNLAARQAIQDGFEDYIFFVNMDTEFDPEFINEAIKVHESDPQIGLVQSKLLLHPPVNGEYFINSLGNSMTFLGFGYCAGDGKQDDNDDTVRDITYGSGAGISITRENWEKIGDCDESYFMYHDDAEISFKVKLIGLRVVVAPKSIIYHKHEFGRSIMQVTFMERNRMRFLLEFFKWPTLLLIFPAFLIMEIGMFPYVVINKWTKAKFKTYAWFFKPENIKSLIKKRRKVQAMRQISDQQLLQGFTGVIEFQQISNPILDKIANPIFNFYWQIIKKIIVW